MIIRGSFLGIDTKASKSQLELRKAIIQLVLITHDRQLNLSDIGLLHNTSLKPGQLQETVHRRKNNKTGPKCVSDTKQIIFHMGDLIRFLLCL